jgi:hypothetical protein
MVALLFTSIFIFGLVALALYLWVPRAKDSEPGLLPPASPLRGLFGDAEEPVSPSNIPIDPERERNLLQARAATGDKSALDAAHALGDRVFYTDLLRQLTSHAQSKEALLALASYVTRNNLSVTRELANAIVTRWSAAPDRMSTPTALHLAALADDAEFYRKTVDAAFNFWRRGLLADISAPELRALFDGEFWVLSAPTRNSAAGFVLKRTLASVRRELESAMHDKS